MSSDADVGAASAATPAQGAERAGTSTSDRRDLAGDVDIDEAPSGGLVRRQRRVKVRKHPRVRKYVKRGLRVVAVLMIPVVYSYARGLTGPGNDSVQARSVEWMREHHLGGVVDRVEKVWYAHHQARIGGTPGSQAGQLRIEPPVTVGGQTLETAPTANSLTPATADPLSTVTPTAPPVATNGSTAATNGATFPPQTATPGAAPHPVTVARLNPPVTLVSPAPAPVVNEGVWTGVGTATQGRYGAYATVIRPDAVHTSVLDAVVWIDPAVLSLRQYPGQKIPGAPWDRPDFIEVNRRAALVAAFEGGFRLADSKGGMFLGGATLSPLRDGAATLVIDRNGVPNIGAWGRDFTSVNGLDSARQNLDLIVDGGVVAPRLANDANRTWGFTGPANKDAVWRAGAGVTADGALVWVGGDGLSIVGLANTLVRAGAVRGMQLDINHEWVQFNTYAADASGTVHGSRLLAAMQHSNDRYLTEDTRDFIAVFTRSP